MIINIVNPVIRLPTKYCNVKPALAFGNIVINDFFLKNTLLINEFSGLYSIYLYTSVLLANSGSRT